MKKFLFVSFVLVAIKANSQATLDTSIKLDLLRAPSSPASNLLGFAVADVDKPTDVSAFMVSLQSATNSFTKLPSNYAIDLAPYWLFGKGKSGGNTESLKAEKGWNVLQQTFVISVAFRNPDSTETSFNKNSTYGGLGFKVSIFRGELDNETKAKLKKIKTVQERKLDFLQKVQAEIEDGEEVAEIRSRMKDMLRGQPNEIVLKVLDSDEYKLLNETLNIKVNERKQQLLTDSNKIKIDISKDIETSKIQTELNSEVQQLVSTFQIARIGWTWDIAGGISSEFVSKRFDNSKVYNAGLWTTLGYTTSKYGSCLGVLRVLHNPDQIFAKDNAPRDTANISTFDFGLRYVYGRSQSKFNASLEYINRRVLSSNTIKPSYRLVFNAEYAIAANNKLTFSFGRNFDGTIVKDGNLVAALTLLTGFGNNR